MRVADLSAGYAPGAVVLRGVSFALDRGTIAAVLGPNGGGKTTLFRALLGDLPVRRGGVELVVLVGGERAVAVEHHEH